MATGGAAAGALRRFELDGVRDIGRKVGHGSYEVVKELEYLVSCPHPFRKNREGVWQHCHIQRFVPRGLYSARQSDCRVHYVTLIAS